MLTFALYVAAAGAFLSLFTRVSGLVLVLVAMVAVIAAATLLAPALDTQFSLSVTLVTAVVALQVGYAVAVVGRAMVARRSDDARGQESSAVVPVTQNYSQPQDGGPLNHP